MNPRREHLLRSVRLPTWVQNAVFYQIFVDRFGRGESCNLPLHYETVNLEPWDAQPTRTGYKGGDLRGIIEKLSYLGDLGITALCLTPIFAASSNHRYTVQDFFRIDPLLGDEGVFRDLLAAAHHNGIRVILDGVFNHVGRGFYQFADVVENGAASPWANWFRVQGWPISPYNKSRPANYACWYGHRELPELNHANPDVREHLMQVAERWTEFGIDGWRLDAADCISATGFWEEFRSRVRAINPEAYLVAEVVHKAERLLDGSRFDAVTNYPFYTATLRFVGGSRLRREYLRSWKSTSRISAEMYGARARHLFGLYPMEVCLAQMNFLENHDTARLMTMLGDDRDLFIIAHLLMFASPGVPCLYYGSEIGLSGGRDPLCRGSFRAESHWDRELLLAVRNIVRLRRASSALRVGDYTVLMARGDTLVFSRQCKSEAVVVALNVGSTPVRVGANISDSIARQLGDGASVVFGSGCVRHSEKSLILEIPSKSGLVYGLSSLSDSITHNTATRIGSHPSERLR